jgi:hypothetical protein
MRIDRRTDRQTDMTKLRISFRKFANASKDGARRHSDVLLSAIFRGCEVITNSILGSVTTRRKWVYNVLLFKHCSPSWTLASNAVSREEIYRRGDMAPNILNFCPCCFCRGVKGLGSHRTGGWVESEAGFRLFGEEKTFFLSSAANRTPFSW